jgi:streptogramin lyase
MSELTTAPLCHPRWLTLLRLLLLLGTMAACLSMTISTACADEEQAHFQTFPVELLTHPYISDMATSSDGSVWFIESAEYYEPYEESRARIERLNSTGSLLGEFSIPTGRQPDVPEQSFPTTLAAGAGGEMWFTDNGTDSTGHHLIGRISPAGRVVEYPTPSSSSASHLYNLALDAHENIWFTDSGSGTVGIMTPTGAILDEFSAPHEAPTAIARSINGEMWFIDGDYVDKVDAAGNVTNYPIPPNKTFPVYTSYLPRGIAAGPDGDMWLVTSGFYEGVVPVGSVIVRVDPSGGTTEYPERFTFAGLHDIAAGPDGDMWFGGVAHAGLGRIDMRGNVTEFAPPIGEVNATNLAVDASGDIWMVPGYNADEPAAHIWRFTTPLMPLNESPPILMGSVTVSATLTSTTGLWLHKPATISYQWQTCGSAGNVCVNIAGNTAATHVVDPDDIGHTLRAIVTVSGPGGSASSTSDPSSVVAAPPSPPIFFAPTPPVAQVPTPLLSLTSVTGAWRFNWSHRYTVVRSLAIRGVPTGATVQVGCRGTGCPFAQRQLGPTQMTSCRPEECHQRGGAGAINLAPWFGGRHLGPRSQIAVGVYRSGYVRRVFRFTMRKRRSPLVQFGCSSPLLQNVGNAC